MSLNVKGCQRAATPLKNSVSTKLKKVKLFDFDEQLMKLLHDCDENIVLKPEKFQNKSELYSHLVQLEEKLDSELAKHDNDGSLQEHMTELHNYNELKDATQQLLGAISAQIGISVKELHKEFQLWGCDCDTESGQFLYHFLCCMDANSEELSSSSSDVDDALKIDKTCVDELWDAVARRHVFIFTTNVTTSRFGSWQLYGN